MFTKNGVTYIVGNGWVYRLHDGYPGWEAVPLPIGHHCADCPPFELP
jgi:hypothetical protein